MLRLKQNLASWTFIDGYHLIKTECKIRGQYKLVTAAKRITQRIGMMDNNKTGLKILGPEGIHGIHKWYLEICTLVHAMYYNVSKLQKI